jgi:predicted nucleic acid-binding protein
MLAVVDTGPLYAVADADDADHEACLDVLRTAEVKWLIPALVVAETTYLIGSRLGPRAESKFLSTLTRLEIEAPLPEEWSRIAELVERYAKLKIGGTDASVVALAERLETNLVITLDRRHFSVIRPKNGKALRLLP